MSENHGDETLFVFKLQYASRAEFVDLWSEQYQYPKESLYLLNIDQGGAIWRIFWLHCCFPTRFPIYDQHVHRAMVYTQRREIEELGLKRDSEKIESYCIKYLTFYASFGPLNPRSVDRALWAYGRFLKSYHAPPIKTASNPF